MSVENGWERPTIAISEWSTAQMEAASFNNKAMNVIFNVVSMEEFKRISNTEDCSHCMEHLVNCA